MGHMDMAKRSRSVISFHPYPVSKKLIRIVVAQLFGYVHGLGMSVITFDWAQIALVLAHHVALSILILLSYPGTSDLL